MTVLALHPQPLEPEDIAALLALHPLPKVAGQSECRVRGRLFNPMGIAPHLDKHRREAGLLDPRKRPGAGPRKKGRGFDRSNITRVAIMDVLVAEGAPMRTQDVSDRMGLTDRLERKSVSNRLGVLASEGKVRKVRVPNSANVAYEVPRRRGRPPIDHRLAAEARASVALDGDTHSIEPMPMPAPQPSPSRAPLTVEDACAGMLLGMSGKDSIPIAALPEVVRWMGTTAHILDIISQVATVEELAELREARWVESEACKAFKEYPSEQRYHAHRAAHQRLVAVSQRVR